MVSVRQERSDGTVGPGLVLAAVPDLPHAPPFDDLLDRHAVEHDLVVRVELVVVVVARVEKVF